MMKQTMQLMVCEYSQNFSRGGKPRNSGHVIKEDIQINQANERGF